jgi:DNA-binding HxlR family transcriptional regulator
MKAAGKSKADPAIFFGNWTVEILFLLSERPHRHGQLQRRLKGVSTKDVPVG